MGIQTVFHWLISPFSRLSNEEFETQHAELLKKAPVPTFWLFGKAQSGKSSLVKYMTGAEDVQIGNGFRPTTKHSSRTCLPSRELAARGAHRCLGGGRKRQWREPVAPSFRIGQAAGLGAKPRNDGDQEMLFSRPAGAREESLGVCLPATIAGRDRESVGPAACK
jgi:hypothetical protein